MNWDLLKPLHYYQEPVEHIYARNIFDEKLYDILYENQNNMQHQVWMDFDKQYKKGFELKENFTELDINKEVICLWFFKERSDRTLVHVEVGGKKIEYYPNTFLITKNKKIKLIETKRKFIRNPFLQIDLSNDDYQEIIKRFQK
tara:strand:+ start:2892 stop:3323 length:432 start_codon:yes stop_codon:yes gene_type:complete